MTRRLIEDDFTAVEAVIRGKVVWVVPYKDIYEAPTVDAEPIRHGEWIECEGRNNEYYCSECYDIWKSDRIKNMKYCPSCGAKMKFREQSMSENFDELDDLSEELLRAQGIIEHFGEEVGKIAEELGKTLSEIAERFADACDEYLKSEDDNDRKTD